MYEKWLDTINKCSLFQDMNPVGLQAMFECMGPRLGKYKKGENLAIEGEKFEGIGIMLSGEAAVTKENAAGNRVIIDIVGPSDMFGEIAAFSAERAWPATVVAQDNCEVLFLPPDKIISECQNLCLCHKNLVNNMLRIISDKALMLNKKVEYLTVKSLRGKISKFLLEQQRTVKSTTFLMPMNRNELADFLNVSRPSLSREMARMMEEGIIDFYRSSVKIKDMEGLKNMIE
ncbi:cAMP receptor protein [Oxobacter pfennigii]|uniref:cAMP receptor protein n=1 Tax=Oxobacter pfennigii TaxID=36849 RepID=A0A0N8NTA1_9CLOT|nr:Crp/Fnr family transcriptional regulator [Oxobacter pfennigii]KPU44256.1 cAMP receptor protein [Oxobacter pfennigii]